LPVDLLREIQQLGMVLSINADIHSLYDVKTSVTNRYNKGGRVIWTMARLFHVVSYYDNLSLKQINQSLKYCSYILKTLKEDNNGLYPLIYKTANLLNLIKQKPDDIKYRHRLKEIYRFLKINNL
ncbi:MAG: hypothetical protein OEZ36_05380, partial [Spirochaetota bacterium]|nr:hypothetical protein [Spirochaetota bacterium]